MDGVKVGTQDSPAWLDMLQQLMPRGIAWNLSQHSQQTKLLSPLAATLATTDSECETVALEMQLDKTQLLLPEYESYFGLPECIALAPTVTERRNNLVTKDKLKGGLATWQIELLAADLGFEAVEFIQKEHLLIFFQLSLIVRKMYLNVVIVCDLMVIIRFE